MGVRLGDYPKTIDATIKLKGSAERLAFKVTFVNKTGSQYRELVASGISLGQLLVELISSWDAEIPLSVDGFEKLEDERPGVCEAFMEGYHKARRLTAEGN